MSDKKQIEENLRAALSAALADANKIDDPEARKAAIDAAETAYAAGLKAVK